MRYIVGGNLVIQAKLLRTNVRIVVVGSVVRPVIAITLVGLGVIPADCHQSRPSVIGVYLEARGETVGYRQLQCLVIRGAVREVNVVAFERIRIPSFQQGKSTVPNVAVAIRNEWPASGDTTVRILRTLLQILKGIANRGNTRVRAGCDVAGPPGGQLRGIDCLDAVDGHECDFQVTASGA